MGARKWVIGSTVVAAIAITAGGIISLKIKERQHEQTKSDLAVAQARAKSLGIPLYAEDLKVSPIPDKENAWTEIHEINKQFEENGFSWPSASEFSRIDDRDEFLARSEIMIQKFEPIYQQVHLLMLKDKYVPDRDWAQGMAMMMPDLASYKRTIHALCVRARTRFFNDDLAGSIDDLHSAKRIADLLGSERSLITVAVNMSLEKIIATEVIRQGRYAISDDYKSQLKSVLDSMFQPVDLKTIYEQEIVMFLDLVLMVSDEDKKGNGLRKEIDDMDGHSLAGKLAGSSLSAAEARKFEVLGVQAACDLHEKISPRIEDYVKNDERYAKFVELPTGWVDQGFPYGLYEIFDALGVFDTSFGIGPYGAIARHSMDSELFQNTFEIVTSSVSLDDGAKWSSARFEGAEFEYLVNEGGFSITVTAPGLDPNTKKFVTVR